MDLKKNDIVKSLEELEFIFNNNMDCSKNPKLCNFSTLLSQTINKTILFLENHNTTTNTTNTTNTTTTTYKNNIISTDTNINYEQLSKFNNCSN
jgi:hypothetical protein